MRKKCRCQTLIQQNIIIYNTTINTHCSWSTSTNTSDFCTIPALLQDPSLHALISSHMHSLLYITEDKTPYVCCLYTKIQIRKYDSCFWSKPREGQNTLAVVTESSQKNTEGDCDVESVCLYFTQDDREVDVDSWVIQSNDSL